MKYTAVACSIAMLFIHTTPAFADKNKKVLIDSVVVIGSQELMNIDKNLAGSVDVITRDELEYEHVTDTLELFTKIPGVVLSRFNQGIINTDISIRGFAGDGTTPHAKLLVDGIPSNLHNGYNEMDYMFPTNIQHIQVFKGTSDPTTGLFATAGNYKIETRKDVGKQLQASFGSFNTRELQGYYGEKTGDITQNYAFGYRAGNGFRDHTSNEKIALSGRWQYDFEKSSLALSAKYGKYNASEAPGYLGKQEARDNPRRSADFANQDNGQKEFKHISLHYDYFINTDAELSLKAYSQGVERIRNVRFSAAQTTVENRVDDQNMRGIIARFNWRLNPNWSVQSGYDIEQQKVLEQRFRGTQTRRDFDFDFKSQGAFVQIENTPLNWLRWNAALRADRLDGEENRAFVINNIPTNRRMFDFGTIMQPKLNVFANLTDTQTVFANYGRSFQHPFGGDMFTSGNTSLRDVAINDGWELGLKSGWGQLNTRVSYWQQVAKDEFVVIDGDGQNVGETKRHGFDASFDVTLNEQWSMWANASKVFAKVTKAATANLAFSGNYLRGIPDHTASIGLQYAHNDRLLARLHVDRQGAYYLNEANIGGKYGAYTLTSANIDYKTNWGVVSLQANNIFDKFYEYAFDQSINNALVDSIHSPGAGRNFTVSTSVNF